MKYMLEYLKPLKLRMSVGLTAKVVGTVVELFLPYILSHILGAVVISESIAQIAIWGVIMVLCAAVACVLNIFANRSAARIARDFTDHMRSDLFTRTMKLSAAQTDRFTVPSLESRLTSDTYNVHNFVSMMQRLGVRAPILLIGGIGVTLIMDRHLALVMIGTLPLIFATVYFISKKGIPLYTTVQKSSDGMVRVVREDTQGIRVIKALSKNEYENKRFEAVNDRLSDDEKRAGIITGSVNPIMTLLMNLGITGVVALAAVRVSGGVSDAETVIAFIQYFTLISMAMMSLSRMFVTYTKCAASARRITEVLTAEEDLTVLPCDEKFDTDMPHIAFEDVSFSYNGVKMHLEDISFSLKRGEKLGIIGSTGSGKTTLIRLLMRLYDTSCGSVKIYGRDIRTVPKEELRDMYGIAFQNDFLYADTIAENIRFGRELYDDEIVKAAKIAQAHDFISAFPDGYSHMLTQKATNLSGGQKQRLLIARAVAARPSILILDDSSSALDYKTDANLRAALRESFADSTVITVAQRVSSIKDCDRIIVLDEGRIIGLGTHEELIENCVEYREISDSQMGGAFVE